MEKLHQGILVHPVLVQRLQVGKASHGRLETVDKSQQDGRLRVRVEFLVDGNEPQEAGALHCLDAHQGPIPATVQD